MRKLALVLALLSTTVACTAQEGDGAESASENALTTLTTNQCKSPTVKSSAMKDSSGDAIDGTAVSSVDGCVVGSQGESGTAVVDRVQTLLGNTSKIGQLKDDDGQAIFATFKTHTATGSLTSSGGLVQDVDVVLNMDASPKAKIRVVRKRTSDGKYVFHLSNTTDFKAHVLLFDVTAINAGDLKLDVTMTPAANGITVSGKASVVLQQEKDKAEQASAIVKNVFSWLKEQLAASAPPPVADPPSDPNDDGNGDTTDDGAGPG